MEPFGALPSEVAEANLLKNMVGPCGLEPQTSTVSKVVQDIALCGLGCGLEINTEASTFCFLYSTNKLFTLWICATKSSGSTARTDFLQVKLQVKNF
jgi:hypothetical protein